MLAWDELHNLPMKPAPRSTHWQTILCAVFFLVLGPVCSRAQVLVWSMGNNQTGTQFVADYLMASGQFTSVTAINSTTLTINELDDYEAVLFFSNGSGDPLVGNALADFADLGRRLVIATFAWANQGGNTVGGRIISGNFSPIVVKNSSLYTNVTIASTDGGSLFANVSAIQGYYHDSVMAIGGAVVHATWSDGMPLVVSKDNVVAVNLFPDGTAGSVSGDYQQLFVNALVMPVPEPGTYALLGLGLGVVAWIQFRRRRR